MTHAIFDLPPVRAGCPWKGRARARGIASIEAVLFLPILILIFAGIQLVTRSNMALMHARSQARSCAWRVAAAGCEAIPDECTSGKSEGTTSASAKERLEKSGALADTGESAAVNDEVTSRLDGLLVERTTSSASVSYKRPLLFVPEEERDASEDASLAKHTSEYRLPCNSIPSDSKNISQAIWDELRH
jgi:hypothetical protein